MYTFFDEDLSLATDDLSSVNNTVLVDLHTIYKPRVLFWEWLFYSKDSTFRENLHQIFKKKCGYSPISHFPELQYYDIAQLNFGGRVSKLELSKIDNTTIESDDKFFEKLGFLLGFLSWFGIRDNSPQDIAIGLDSNEKMILAPLDIKKIFIRMSSPNQTGLFPSHYCANCMMSSGLFFLYSLISFKELSKRAPEIISGYLACLEVLNENEEAINSYLLETFPQINEVPIHITTRFDYYAKALNSGYLHFDDVANLVPAKTRKFIVNEPRVPAFFRYLNDGRVFFFSSLEKKKILCPDIEINRDEYIFIGDKGFEKRDFESLFNEGSRQLASAFQVGQ